MRPKAAIADDACECRPCDVFSDRILLQKIKARLAVKAFQVSIFMEMFDGAAHIVDFAHHVVMAGSDEQFGPALELLLGLPRIGQDKAINAAGVLVKPVKDVLNRSRIPVDAEGGRRQQHDKR